jgi:uncharacterized protein YjbI with pentapeptide repeats
VFDEVRLNGANLEAANLNGVKLIRTYLKGANLSHAKLRGAILEKVILANADLSYADFSGAAIDADLTGVIFQQTIMPDGSIKSNN